MNDIEVQRLELVAERQLIDVQRTELEFEKEHHENEKKEFDTNGAKLVAATNGQALLVEEEVKRRLKEEKAREDFQKKAIEAGGIDADL